MSSISSSDFTSQYLFFRNNFTVVVGECKMANKTLCLISYIIYRRVQWNNCGPAVTTRS